MTSGLIKSLKALCCCTSADDGDNDNLIGNEQEYDWTQSNNTNRHLTNGNANNPSAGNFRNNDANSVQTQSARTQSEAEEDALNKILDRTQQCIIDVGNLDNINGLDIDIAQRSRLYSEAVRRHDAQFDKKTNPLNFAPSSTDAPTSSSAVSGTPADIILLADTGNQAGEILSKPANTKLDTDEYALLCRTSELLYDAVLSNSRVELREELIAYMSQDN